MKEIFGWGFLLWLFGYILGIVLFMFVPQSYLGWVIMPFGVVFTVWVLLKKIQTKSYLTMAIVWTVMAVVLDYLFIVKLLNPADGYYKLDVFIYYGLTFLLPLVVGGRKNIIS